MIVGSYSLHLYCDNTKWHGDCLHLHVVTENQKLTNEGYRGGFAEYIGQTYGECVRYARKDGWVVAHDQSTAYCPRCKKRRGAKQERNKAFVNHRMH